jgi:hypothetical protein
MGRAWRIEYEGALYHLLSRGNERGDIFYDNTDRGRFFISYPHILPDQVMLLNLS